MELTPYYQDDAVTIYHGDCRSLFTRREFAALGFDVIVSDPPYGIDWKTEGKSRGAVRDYPRIEGDDQPFDPTWLLAYDKPTALFGANHYADLLPTSPAWLVWDKRIGMASNDQSDCELVWTNVGGRARMIRYQFNGGGSLARENGVPMRAGRPVGLHPTQKPLAVMRQILEWMPEGSVLDPYMGSGSTLVAAKSLGRKSIGIEILEEYCERAANRCRQETLGLSA